MRILVNNKYFKIEPCCKQLENNNYNVSYWKNDIGGERWHISDDLGIILEDILFCPYCGKKLPQEYEITKLVKESQGYKFPQQSYSEKLIEEANIHQKTCRVECEEFCNDFEKTPRCHSLLRTKPRG